MIGLYAQRISVPFISSATPTSACRITSTVIGSSGSDGGNRNVDHEVPVPLHGAGEARRDHRRRTDVGDDGRPGNDVAGTKVGATPDGSIEVTVVRGEARFRSGD